MGVETVSGAGQTTMEMVSDVGQRTMDSMGLGNIRQRTVDFEREHRWVENALNGVKNGVDSLLEKVKEATESSNTPSDEIVEKVKGVTGGDCSTDTTSESCGDEKVLSPDMNVD